ANVRGMDSAQALVPYSACPRTLDADLEKACHETFFELCVGRTIGARRRGSPVPSAFGASDLGYCQSATSVHGDHVAIYRRFCHGRRNCANEITDQSVFASLRLDALRHAISDLR